MEFEEHNLKVIATSPFLTVKQNVYLTKNNTDLLQFLEKFAMSLYSSEGKGQNVIVLSHIPFVNEDNLTEFEACLKAIFQRFQNTIQTIISAHDHRQDLYFISDKAGSPILFNFLAPSLTTMASYNPQYQIFLFQENSFVDNIYTYFLDAELYNQRADKGDFYIQYDLKIDFRRDYEIDQMS